VRNVSDGTVEKIEARIFNNIFFFGKLSVYALMWKNMVQGGSRAQMTIRYNAVHALWMPDNYGKNADTQS